MAAGAQGIDRRRPVPENIGRRFMVGNPLLRKEGSI
jgi:hypothetical protein